MKNGVIVETMMISRTDRKPAFSIRTGFRYPQGHSFGLGRQTPSLIVVEPKLSAAKLLLEDSILFAKVVDGELLLLVHPSGHGDQQRTGMGRGLSASSQPIIAGPESKCFRPSLINKIEILDATPPTSVSGRFHRLN